MFKIFNVFLKKTTDNHEFHPILTEIEEHPVNPLGRLVFWTIVVLFIFAILWTSLGKMDVVVSSRGKVVPQGEVKIIQSLETGVVTDIYIEEGSFVKKDQVLIELNLSSTEPELNSVRATLVQTNLEIKKLQALANGTAFKPGADLTNEASQIQNDAYRASIQNLESALSAKDMEISQLDDKINSLTRQKKFLKDLLATNEEKETRLKKVLDLIAKDDYDKVVNDIEEERSKIDELGFELNELNHKKLQFNQEILQIKSNFKVETIKLLVEKKTLSKELQAKSQDLGFKNAKKKILSPIDGYVVNLEIHTIGAVVEPAQKLISIVPQDQDLIIQAFVKNQDIGFVKEKMPVTVKVDTYNFQKYGTLAGVVTHVAKNSIDDPKLGRLYEIFVSLKNKELTVEGKKEKITIGMEVTAEVNVGKRRIIEFFVYPIIKYWDEGMKVR